MDTKSHTEPQPSRAPTCGTHIVCLSFVPCDAPLHGTHMWSLPSRVVEQDVTPRGRCPRW